MEGNCSIASAAIRGVEAFLVEVEVAVLSGLPGVHVVGMPDVAVQEAKERVRAALKSSGFSMPNERIVVNLAPSNLKKVGSGFDLPIAMGILTATGQIPRDLSNGKLIVGELGLDGSVRSVPGNLAFGVCAREFGLDFVCSSRSDAVPIDGLFQYGLEHLGCLSRCEGDSGDDFASVVYTRAHRCSAGVHFAAGSEEPLDFGDICGHEVAKRALQIAAAGNHGVLMMGPPVIANSLVCLKSKRYRGFPGGLQACRAS